MITQAMYEDPNYDVILYQSLFYFFQITASETLTELIDNNKVVLEKKIKP